MPGSMKPADEAAQPLSVSAFLCEKVLNESGVLSAIRIVDVFTIVLRPDVAREKQIFQATLLFIARFEPGPITKHEIQLYLGNPSGEEAAMGETLEMTATVGAEYPGHPYGVNVIAPFGLAPKTSGVYYIRVILDGRQVAKILFTVITSTAEE